MSGAIGAIRTRDLPLRRRTLYPTELQPQRTVYILPKATVIFKENLVAPAGGMCRSPLAGGCPRPSGTHDEIDDESEGDEPHDPADFLVLADGGLHERVAHEAEREAVGDRARERHHDDGKERRQGVGEVREIDLPDLLHHERADEDERRRRREARHETDERREDQRDEEADGDRHGREPRLAARRDARGALDVACDRRGAEDGGADRAHGVRRERAVEVLDLAVRLHELRLRREADERAHVVEELDDRKREDNGDDAIVPRADDVELAERLAHVRHARAHDIRDTMRHRRVAETHGEQRRRDDADEDGALYLARHERAREHEAEEREQRRRLRHMTEADERRLVRHDEARALEADESDEEADAHADGHAQILRHGVDDGLADVTDREDQEQDAREEHRAECDCPVQAERAAHIVGEKGVESHARRERDRIVGDDAHDHRRERRDPDGRGDGRIFRDARLGKNVRIDEDDIGERDERRESRQDLRLDRRLLLRELEIAREEAGRSRL